MTLKTIETSVSCVFRITDEAAEAPVYHTSAFLLSLLGAYDREHQDLALP